MQKYIFNAKPVSPPAPNASANLKKVPENVGIVTVLPTFTKKNRVKISLL